KWRKERRRDDAGTDLVEVASGRRVRTPFPWNTSGSFVFNRSERAFAVPREPNVVLVYSLAESTVTGRVTIPASTDYQSAWLSEAGDLFITLDSITRRR